MSKNAQVASTQGNGVNKSNGGTATAVAVGVATPGEGEKPKPSKARIKELFAAYDKANDARVAADQAQIAAVQKLSDCIKAIEDECGNGPFVFKGVRLTISSRNGTYFFRGQNVTGAIEV